MDNSSNEKDSSTNERTDSSTFERKDNSTYHNDNSTYYPKDSSTYKRKDNSTSERKDNSTNEKDNSNCGKNYDTSICEKTFSKCPSVIWNKAVIVSSLMEIPSRVWSWTESYFFPYQWFTRSGQCSIAEKAISNVTLDGH
jgi:hypothetical protein